MPLTSADHGHERTVRWRAADRHRRHPDV